jgi:transcriptional regulator with XRE-family HTH domain
MKKLSIEEQCDKFVDELRTIRYESNITLNKLSDLTGIRQSNLTRIETGKSKPGLETIVRILSALDKELKIV